MPTEHPRRLALSVALALCCCAAAPKLDLPPKPAQKPYAPALNRRVAVNPPPFIWVPDARNAVYALQVSTSEAFTGPTTRTFADIRRSVFVPDRPLKPGRWYWRYGVKTPDGVVYGKARPFTVPADAREFPLPDFDAVLRSVPKQRPRLLFPGRRLEQIRTLARGELKTPVASLLRHCEKSIGRPIVPEPPKPKSAPERVTVMRTTRPPMDDMERCALAYLLTGERKFGLEAKRRLLHFFSWDPNGPTGLWGYDEPAMWMMMRGTRAYDWTADLFTPAERSRIEPAIKTRAKQFYIHLKDRRRFETNPYESHAGRMPGFLGEAALSFAHEWPEAKTWLEYATLLYCTSYPAWGGDDGGWQEGPGYWSAYMGFALHYVAALRQATGVDLMRKPFFRNTGYYALYTATPYHEHRPFGDGQTGSPAGLGYVLYAFSTLAGDPYLRWYADQSRRRVGADLLTLATYDPALKAKSPRDLPAARVFPSVGLAAIHTDLGRRDRDITFLFRSSPFGSVSHGHADQNAFVIEAFGRGLALATGYYPWYGSRHHHDWTRATRAVNSILVDGQGQVRRSWLARGAVTAFHTDPRSAPTGYDYVEGEAAPAYGKRLQRFRRHVVHVRDGIFVIFDDLVAAKPARFQWLLHAHDRFAIAGRTLTVRRDPADMTVHILLPSPKDLKLSQTDEYDPPPEQHKTRPREYKKTWHLTAATTRSATAAQFLTVFIVRHKDRPQALPQVTLARGKGAVGVTLTHPGGGSDVVAFRTDPSAREVSCAHLKSPARVFAEGTDPSGKTTRSLAVPRIDSARN